MRLSSSLHSPIVPHFSGRGSPRRKTVKILRNGVRRCTGIRAATRDDRTDGNDGSDGRLVDSDLPALRRRIREVGSKDKGGIAFPLSNRVISVGTHQYRRAIFKSEACEVLAAVRLDPGAAPSSEADEGGGDRRRRAPRLEIGVTVTVSFSVPVPVLVIMLYAVDVAQGVLDRMHQNTKEEDAMH